MVKIKELKKELGLSNKEIAEFFGMSYGAYANSTAKKRYEGALCLFYEHVKQKEGVKIEDDGDNRCQLEIKQDILFAEMGLKKIKNTNPYCDEYPVGTYDKRFNELKESKLTTILSIENDLKNLYKQIK